MQKVFIVSLPRTGTTSICLLFLDHGFKVAHTAFTQDAIDAAEVVADTPVFVDFIQLYNQYPRAKFIYLERPREDWLSSIHGLLRSMVRYSDRQNTPFEPEIIRCFESSFPSFKMQTTKQLVDCTDYLNDCYEHHAKKLMDFFADKPNQFMKVALASPTAGTDILRFCNEDKVESTKLKRTTVQPEPGELHENQPQNKPKNRNKNLNLPHVNRGRRISYWQDVSHKNKIDPYFLKQ